MKDEEMKQKIIDLWSKLPPSGTDLSDFTPEAVKAVTDLFGPFQSIEGADADERHHRQTFPSK